MLPCFLVISATAAVLNGVRSLSISSRIQDYGILIGSPLPFWNTTAADGDDTLFSPGVSNLLWNDLFHCHHSQGIEGRGENPKPGIPFPATFDPRSLQQQPTVFQPGARSVELREINPGFSATEEEEDFDPFLQVLQLVKHHSLGIKADM